MTTFDAVVSYKAGTCGDFLVILLVSGHPNISEVKIGNSFYNWSKAGFWVGDPPEPKENNNTVSFKNNLNYNFYATVSDDNITGKVNWIGYQTRETSIYFDLKDMKQKLEEKQWEPHIISGHFHMAMHLEKGTPDIVPLTTRELKSWVQERFKDSTVLFTKTTTDKSLKLFHLNDYVKNMKRDPETHGKQFDSFEDMMKNEDYIQGAKKFSISEGKMLDSIGSTVIELEDIYDKEKLRSILAETFSWWDDLYYDDLHNMYMMHQNKIPELKNII